MPWHPTLSQLRDRLADLYPTEADARRVVADARMDDRRIAFYPSAINTWHSIMFELRMRQTKATRVCRVPEALTVGDAATYLARKLLPKVAAHYLWTLARGDASLPRDATCTAAGIQPGDSVFLVGENKLPPRFSLAKERNYRQ